MYYLYIKTHTVTGLKYLRQTKQKDFHLYTGSGARWKSHLANHGYTYTTVLLKECQDKSELKEWGMYYSNLWNITDSKEWANLCEESGTGGDTSKSEKYQIGIKNRDTSGEKNSMYGRSAVQEQNLRWYTNGDKNIYITEGTQPNNFNPGRSNLKRKPHSEETKIKLSQHGRRKCVAPDGTVYNSRKEAALAYDLTPEGIGKRCKTAYLGWRYL